MKEYRTHYCDQITKEDVGKKVRIAGFVETIRDLGGLVFLDIKDMYGVTQVVTSKESSDVDNLLFSGKDLICIKNRDFSERNTRIALKKLFKVIVDSLLNGRTLKSRALYSQFLMVK